MNEDGLPETPPPPGERIEFKVLKQFTDARRLDHYIASRLQVYDVSRAAVQKLIAAGVVFVDGVAVKPSHKVKQGEIISLTLPERYSQKPEPQEMPLEILYEDEFMVVLNKQADLIVHPGRGKENWSGTLTNALQFYFDRLSTIGGAARPGIVHRLDRDTTGVILVAKDDHAHKNLGLQFERRQVHKEYLALCYGIPDRDQDFVNRPIGPHPSVREKMAIREDPKIGRPAKTFYSVKERFAGYSLVQAEPHTGRTHQIRVHLTHVGTPIVADAPYAGRDSLRLSELTQLADGAEDAILISRQALHAHRIRFRHPRCHEEMEIEAPLPTDFAATLEALRTYRKL